jgi:hypothetical protein
MNRDAIYSLLRHALTSLAALGGFLASHGVIAAGDVATVNAAGVSLGDAFSVILSAIVARVVIWLMALVFGNSGPGLGGGAGALGLLAVGLMIAGSASSCSTAQLSEYKAVTSAVPVQVGASYNGLTAVYSSRNGISVIYDAAGKPVGTVALPEAPVPPTPSTDHVVSATK